VTDVRRAASAVGALFVVATGCYVVGQTLHGPFLGSVEALELAFPNRPRVVAGLLLELVGVLAIPLIALVFYPILRLHAEALALCYVGLRLLEAAALLTVDANLWSMVSLSEAYHTGGGPAADLATQLGSLQAVSESAFLISVAIVFPIGSCLLNYVLWSAQLVPRLIAGWGMFGAALLFMGSLLNFFGLLAGVPAGVLEAVLSGPIALQEMVLAVWLIAKGVTETESSVGSA
jgi:hypothetical protein